jgi:hypothetical protein
MALVEKRREVLAILGSESIRHEQLRQVEEALERLDTGEFGCCQCWHRQAPVQSRTAGSQPVGRVVSLGSCAHVLVVFLCIFARIHPYPRARSACHGNSYHGLTEVIVITL